MKRVFLLVLCFLVFSTPAFGESTLSEPLTTLDSLGADGVSLLGGTAEWPEFHGHLFGASMQQVMLMEQDCGSSFVYFDYNGCYASAADQAANCDFSIHFLTTSLTVCGRTAIVDYQFTENALAAVHIGIPVADESEGQTVLSTLADEITAVYGAENKVYQGEHSWLVGYGYQYFSAWEGQSDAEGFSGRILLSCAPSENAWDQWEQGTMMVQMSMSLSYRQNTGLSGAQYPYSAANY